MLKCRILELIFTEPIHGFKKYQIYVKICVIFFIMMYKKRYTNHQKCSTLVLATTRRFEEIS